MYHNVTAIWRNGSPDNTPVNIHWVEQTYTGRRAEHASWFRWSVVGASSAVSGDKEMRYVRDFQTLAQEGVVVIQCRPGRPGKYTVARFGEGMIKLECRRPLRGTEWSVVMVTSAAIIRSLFLGLCRSSWRVWPLCECLGALFVASKARINRRNNRAIIGARKDHEASNDGLPCNFSKRVYETFSERTRRFFQIRILIQESATSKGTNVWEALYHPKRQEHPDAPTSLAFV